MRVKRLLLACGIWTTACTVVAASDTDFAAGLNAYRDGDFSAAYEIWEPLAESGMAEAQYNLGLLYHGGKGVKLDRGRALEWYLRAATGGFPRAQYKVAELYESGDGTRPDLSKAHFWFSMAKRAKFEDAGKRRKRLAERMTSSEIAMAELRMRQQKRRERGEPDVGSLD